MITSIDNQKGGALKETATEELPSTSVRIEGNNVETNAETENSEGGRAHLYDTTIDECSGDEKSESETGNRHK